MNCCPILFFSFWHQLALERSISSFDQWPQHPVSLKETQRWAVVLAPPVLLPQHVGGHLLRSDFRRDLRKNGTLWLSVFKRLASGGNSLFIFRWGSLSLCFSQVKTFAKKLDKSERRNLTLKKKRKFSIGSWTLIFWVKSFWAREKTTLTALLCGLLFPWMLPSVSFVVGVQGLCVYVCF